jgi:threonine dehydratase
MTTQVPPTFSDVLDARRRIRDYLQPTPLHYYPGLSKILGCEAYVKHENHQPVGAFKVRGGINLCSRLSTKERERGVIAASTGNHGQSVAYGAGLFGIKATIVVPEEANPDKVEAMRNLGAEILFHGKDYEECKNHCQTYAQEKGMRYVSAGDEPLLIAGVGTYSLEIFEALPDVEVIIVPVGGGSGACGACIVANAINPQVRVIGVQAAQAPAVYESWKSGKWVTTESADTFAEGLATLSPFELPLSILRQRLKEFVLVSEDDMRAAIRLLLETTHNLAEGAGAASTAAAMNLRDDLRGKKVVLVLSGGNLTLAQLKDVLAQGDG